MDIHGLFIDNQWIPWIINGYQGIRFVTKWHAIQVERISTRPISMIPVRIFASFKISRFPLLIFLDLYRFLFYIGRHRRPPRISFGAAGATKDHLGGILSFSDFSRNPETMKIDFLVFPMTDFDEIQGNRCGIDVLSFSNPRLMEKRLFIEFVHVSEVL